MRRLNLLLCLVLAVVSITGFGQSLFHAEGDTEGTTVLWFLGTEITIDLTGTLALSVNVTLDEEPVALSCEGTTFGHGIGDSYTMLTTMWILFDTSGTTEDGRSAHLRGGVRLVGDEVDFDSLSLGAGGGGFILVLDLPETSHVVTGTLAATAGGQFVPPDQPGTMQVEGGGTFTFDGDVVDRPETLSATFPWEDGGWPEDFVPHLLATLNNEPLPVEEDAE